jgi:hypothetical protein
MVKVFFYNCSVFSSRVVSPVAYAPGGKRCSFFCVTAMRAFPHKPTQDRVCHPWGFTTQAFPQPAFSLVPSDIYISIHRSVDLPIRRFFDTSTVRRKSIDASICRMIDKPVYGYIDLQKHLSIDAQIDRCIDRSTYRHMY